VFLNGGMRVIVEEDGESTESEDKIQWLMKEVLDPTKVHMDHYFSQF
jgi:hypothetical protein